MAAPAQPNYSIHANTAAELLHYTSYQKPNADGTSEACWSRFASADENFNVADVAGKRYLIQFDKNFSKKHLCTFSKKEWKTDTEAYLQSMQPGQAGQDSENWNRAQLQLLNNKILRTLGIRSGLSADVACSICHHPKKNVVLAGVPTGHSNAGNCQVPGCLCTGYQSAYSQARTDKNKPEANPYAGASASQSSCIVLNWIPKNEFEAAVARAIVVADPTGIVPATAVPMPQNAVLTHLRLEFTGRPGAVRHAMNGAVDVDNGTWCDVGAVKNVNATPGFECTWVICHWNSQG